MSTFSVKNVISFFRFTGDEERRALILWRIQLGGFILSLCVICVVAYQTYIWSIQSVVSKPVVDRSPTLSVAEIDQVLKIYQDKSARYKELLQQRPSIPTVIAEPAGAKGNSPIQTN